MGAVFFGPRCQKKAKKRKKLTDIWKTLFLLFLCFFSFFSLVFIFCVFLGGFKGQVRWPEGPPHLALNPPYLLFFVFFFFFSLSLFFIQKKPFFSLENCIFCLFLRVSLCFPLAFFGLPFFNFSVTLLFFSFFLPSCLYFCFLLVPCVCLFLSFSFFFACVSWKEWHQNIQWQKCSSSIFSLFWFPVLFLFQLPFSYVCYFLILGYVFCSTSMFLVSKNPSWKSIIFAEQGGCNKTVFYQPVFCKMLKVIVFCGHFLANFGWRSKNIIK